MAVVGHVSLQGRHYQGWDWSIPGWFRTEVQGAWGPWSSFWSWDTHPLPYVSSGICA